MSKEEVAERCGYIKVKGYAVLVSEQVQTEDIFIKEDDLKEYWYNDTTEMFYENTEEELTRLCDDEEEAADNRKEG